MMKFIIKIFILTGLLSGGMSYAHESGSEPMPGKTFQAKNHGWRASTLGSNRIFIPVEVPRVVIVPPIRIRPHEDASFRRYHELHRQMHRQYSPRY
jgi:hypothetical protein